jgi:hypothetical protein
VLLSLDRPLRGGRRVFLLWEWGWFVSAPWIRRGYKVGKGGGMYLDIIREWRCGECGRLRKANYPDRMDNGG